MKTLTVKSNRIVNRYQQTAANYRFKLESIEELHGTWNGIKRKYYKRQYWKYQDAAYNKVVELLCKAFDRDSTYSWYRVADYNGSFSHEQVKQFSESR